MLVHRLLCADFNAYYMEQALQNLYTANYTNLETPTDYSYQFRSALSAMHLGRYMNSI